MIVTSPWAWLGMLGMVLLSCAAGCAVAACWRWRDAARASRMPLFWGLALGPLLLGMAAVAVLAGLPGAAHGIHLAGICLLLALPPALLVVLRRDWLERLAPSGSRTPWDWAEKVLLVLLLVWLAGLFANAILIPLTQNDSLEYATVGRILFESRTLASYPAIHPEQTASGFYGPWTHPPLYVAQIYAASLVQGHADAPGFMRLLAPWGLAATVGLLAAWGAQASRKIGLLAALILVTTPLLFLGAESALIDAFPVLGLLLVLVALDGVDGPPAARGAAMGLALGLSLWTHSQAVLFVPLAGAALLVHGGRKGWRAAIAAGLVMLAVALVISVWPYLRNIALFGSPISDNPVVFAMPELAWPDYFTIGRGVDHWPAIVQYGWFKGWFALEAYGVEFWLMLAGVLVVALAWRRGKAMPAAALALALVACYLAGVVASTLLGLDLMIKNERYMLVVVPAVCLLAGFGLARAMSGPRSTALVMLGVAGLFSAQLLVLVGYRFAANGLTPTTLGQPFSVTLAGRAEYLAVDYLRRETPRDTLVFTLKPADMYYSGRRMLSYLDPRMVPFYRERDPGRALRLLEELGVRYVHVADYGLPPLHNSAIEAILRNPQWARLVFQADGNQVYALAASDVRDGPSQDLLGGKTPWTRSTSLVLGGRKALANLAGPAARVDPSVSYQGGLPLHLFHREWSTLLSVGDAPQGAVAAEGGREYAFDVDLEGSGLVRVWLQQFDRNGAPLKDTFLRSQSKAMITDIVLGGTYPARTFSRRFRTLPDAARLVLTLEHVGSSALRVRSAHLVRMSPAP